MIEGLPRPPVVRLPGIMLFQALSGSWAYGLAGPDSDADWRGAFQVPTERLFGLRKPVEAVGLPPDQVYWELRHFAKLCMAGKPNIVELLWLPRRFVYVSSPAYEELRMLRTHFLGRPMLDAYLSWARHEMSLMAPESGGGRPADRKSDRLAGKPGSHLLRLLLSLRGVLRDGELRVALEGAEQAEVLAVKRGSVDPAAVEARIRAVEAECRVLADASGWGPVDPGPVEKLLVAARTGALR